MKQWQDRVCNERDELMVKLTKLQHFIVTAKVPNKDLLRDQADVMSEYIHILDKRIKQWK